MGANVDKRFEYLTRMTEDLAKVRAPPCACVVGRSAIGEFDFQCDAVHKRCSARWATGGTRII